MTPCPKRYRQQVLPYHTIARKFDESHQKNRNIDLPAVQQ
jgi:hypothetical protein